MSDKSQGREIGLEEMMSLRASSEAISAWLRNELEDRLATLRPLLLPHNYLGEHIKSAFRQQVKDASRTFEQLQQLYRDVSGEPFRLPSRLDSPLESISNKLELHPWEYLHEVDSDGEPRMVTVTSPVQWVVMHAGPISLNQARQMLSGQTGRSDAGLKQFAINALLMKLIFERNPGIIRLLEALRFKVDMASSTETGRLPLVRLTSCVPSFRPSDSVILNTTRLSGVAIFEEIIDVEGCSSVPDPIRQKVAELSGEA